MRYCLVSGQPSCSCSNSRVNEVKCTQMYTDVLSAFKIFTKCRKANNVFAWVLQGFSVNGYNTIFWDEFQTGSKHPDVLTTDWLWIMDNWWGLTCWANKLLINVSSMQPPNIICTHLTASSDDLQIMWSSSASETVAKHMLSSKYLI